MNEALSQLEKWLVSFARAVLFFGFLSQNSQVEKEAAVLLSENGDNEILW